MAKPKHSKKFFFWLDQRPAWNWRRRQLRLSGWCVAKSGKSLIAIRARTGGKVFAVALDRERPEVHERLGLKDAPLRCGFVVDVSVRLRKTRLSLEVADEDQSWQEVFSTTMWGPFLTGVDDPGGWQELNARARYDFWFEHPADWNVPTRTLYIAGWCVDRTGAAITAIRARIGPHAILGKCGIERPEIAIRFPNIAHAQQSGFAIAIPAPARRSKFAIELRDQDGHWWQFFSHEVPARSRTARPSEIFALPGVGYLDPKTQKEPRFQFWLARPSDWSKKIRYLRVSGWCVTTSGEPITEIRARIRRKIFHARCGIRRPDVATVFPQLPAAFSSGFLLDVMVPPGRSNFVLEARTATRNWETFFTYPIRGPFFREDYDPEREEFGDYARWIRKYDCLTQRDRQAIQRHIAQFEQQPTISVLLPVYNSTLSWLRRAIDSVRKQLYPHWELCIVDDASTQPEIWPLLEKYARRDPRIKILRRAQNGHISAASNDALSLASGAYIALLDHDDELAPTALYFVALELNSRSDLQLLYSDEDKLDQQGRRCDPYFKPDWNPDLFTSQNYLSHLSVYCTALVREVGGFRPGFEGSQDYDLTLRCIERIDPLQIRHIPRVLYHWRTAEKSTATFAAAKPYAQAAAIRAMQEHLDRLGIAGAVVPHYGDYLRVRFPLPADLPLVSIIIPTRDQVSLLRQCLQSIFDKTDYPNYEIIVLDNESSDSATLDYLLSLGKTGRVRVHRVEGPFNYSKLNNTGARLARGAFIALLNNDLEVINRDWLSEMVSHGVRPEIGAVGARLWYPDKTMQHGGVILGAGGIASHAHAGLRNEHGYFARAHLTQNFSAVTAACILIKKNLYLELGGFDEVNLLVAFNDVDFCLRLAEKGLRVLWTPHAELFHHESASRGFEDTIGKQRRFLAEVRYMEDKWQEILLADPAYNPNLSLGEKLFTLAFPPRVAKPWEPR
jgi:glycosyltransferase involved in cell wall biosynthesis